MNGFISYSHDDYRMFQEFKTHLRAVERAFLIDFWADTRLYPGYYWNSTIEAAIKSADVILLLASPDFIASDYIYEKEIPAIKARHQAPALVIPVVLKRCAWQMIANVLQSTPTEKGRLKPVSDWRRHSDGFDHARTQIALTIEQYFGLAPKSIDWNRP